MILLFEISRPFRFKPRLERYDILLRFIWLWFSFAIVRCSINQLKEVFARSYRNGEFSIEGDEEGEH